MKRLVHFLVVGLLIAGCVSNDSTSVAPDGTPPRFEWTPENPAVCASSGDAGSDFNLQLDGCSPPPATFADQRLKFQYSYIPDLVASPAVSRFVVTYEYRYAETGDPDTRRFGVGKVGKPIPSPESGFAAQSQPFDIKLITEMSASKFVTFTIQCPTPNMSGADCWNSVATPGQITAHHFERVLCVDDQTDATFANAAAVCSSVRWDDINNQNPNWYPIAGFTSSRSLADLQLGDAVVFTATSSDPDMDAMTHRWKLIGSTGVVIASAQGASFSHTFNSAGEYTVRLVSEDQNGGMDVAKGLVRVALPPPPAAPSVTVTGPNYVHALQECSWSATASGGTPPYQSYAWYRRAQYETDSVLVANTKVYSWWVADTTARNYYLTATVTDSLSQTGQYRKTVKVASPGADCIP